MPGEFYTIYWVLDLTGVTRMWMAWRSRHHHHHHHHHHLTGVTSRIWMVWRSRGLAATRGWHTSPGREQTSLQTSLNFIPTLKHYHWKHYHWNLITKNNITNSLSLKNIPYLGGRPWRIFPMLHFSNLKSSLHDLTTQDARLLHLPGPVTVLLLPEADILLLSKADPYVPLWV